MNHYPHHIGDFDARTRHLSRLERAIYRDMRDRYCLFEEPLDGSDFDMLARRLSCRAPDEVAALQFVLDEFFELTPDGTWVNQECDQIIAAYRAQQAGQGVVKGNEKDRKARSRARRSAMFSALREAGVVLPYNTSMAELYRQCRTHGLPLPKDDAGTPHAVTGDGTEPGQVTPRHALGTGKPEPEPKPLIPPNPPAGGAGDSGADASDQGKGGGNAVQVPAATATVTATALCAFFPEIRRTRLAEVASCIASLEADGTVTGEQLLKAAAQQSEHLCRDDGKACPSVLRWLREQRWLDAAAGVGQAGSVPSDWRQTRSGVEAMGERLGLGRWNQERHRLFTQYEDAVVAALEGQTVGA